MVMSTHLKGGIPFKMFGNYIYFFYKLKNNIAECNIITQRAQHSFGCSRGRIRRFSEMGGIGRKRKHV